MFKPGLRKPRFRRCDHPAPVAITERDVRILTLVSRHRLMSSQDLLRLVPGSRQHLVRRLGRLYHAGYLERPRCQLLLNPPPSRHMAYCLANLGQKELRRRGIATFATTPKFDSAASALSLSHSLQVADILTRLEADARAQGLSFRLHHDWFGREKETGKLSVFRWFVRFRHEGRWVAMSLIPDAAFSIEMRDCRHRYFFLEVDRGTMPVVRRSLAHSSFLRKVLAYKETRRAGVLWKRFGIPNFHVLATTKTEGRLRRLRIATETRLQRSKLKMFLFTHLSQMPGIRAFV